MATIGAKTGREILSRRFRSALIATVVLTSTFVALAISQDPNGPQSNPPENGPTATILSPWAVLEPSTKNNPNDKDGFPPTKSEADPEEAFLLAKISVGETIYEPYASLLDQSVDDTDDLTVDDDTPRDLDMLDGLNDGMLAPGDYFLYWNLNKTGYVPVNTTPGSAYNGSNSASISIVDDVEQFQLEITYSMSEGGETLATLSDLYTTEMWKSTSVGQNDLSWIDTQPKVVIANAGDTFQVRSKYEQSSAQGLEWLILQCYFNGLNIRMLSVSLYYYDNQDPGSIVDEVPAGFSNHWSDQQQFTGEDLGDTDNKDYWITEYTFEIREKGYSDVIPYITTKKGGDSWKIDTGYAGFQSRVPGGVNPAVLEISKYFSEGYPGGVVSGPDPPVVGETTVYELSITVANTGADDALNVAVTDTAQLDNVEWLDVYTVTQGTISFDPLTGKVTWSVGTLHPDDNATLSYQISITPTPEQANQTVMLNSGAYTTGRSKSSGAAIDDGPTPPLYTEPVVGVPEMTFTKTADQDTADPGDQITYTLHYENAGSGTAYNVVVVDIIPEHVTYVSSSPQYTSFSGRTYEWSIGQVAAGSSGDITITVQVDAGTPDGTVLANLGKVEYTNGGGEPQNPPDDWHNVTVTAPVMTFQKSADVSTADPGDLITYTLSYENTGTGDATGVVIVDTIPEHTTFVSSTPSPSSISNRDYTFDIGTVAAGASGAVTIVVKVDALTPDGTVLENFAVMNYDDANGNPYPEESDTATTTVTAPVISFEKNVDVAYADPGDIITYTLTIDNSGTGYASGVVLRDTIPLHTSFYDAIPMYTSVSGRTYTWNIGSVAPGETKTVTLKVKVDTFTPDGTSLENTATLDYADANGNSYPQLSDSASTTVTAPVMSMSKVADVSQADPGDLIVYTITFVNDGAGVATGVIVTDTIPEHTSYVSSSPSYSSVSGRTYTWDVGNVEPGDGGSISITVKVVAGTQDGLVLTNEATLDYADANGNYYPQLTDSASTTVTAPVMEFSKTADVTTADPGDIITYTLHYKNSGTGMATGVMVKDTIPLHTSFFDATPWYNDVVGREYSWDIGNVAAGAEGDVILKVKVDAGTPDGTVLLNTAVITYDDANGNPCPEVPDDATVTVTAPVMTFSKDVDVQHADPGDLITYTLTYENIGTGLATGVVVKDTIPLHTTFQSADPWYTSVSDRTYTWELGDVGVGAAGTIEITVKVDAGTADQTVLTNTATLDYDDANGNALPQKSDDASTTVTAPVMTFSKNVDVDFADPGDLLQYTLTYKNTGTGVATDVVVEDTIPLHTTFQTSTPTYSSVDDRTYTWDVGTVDPDVTGTIEITVKVDVGTADETVLTNTATLDYDDANGNALPQKSDDATTVVTSPVMHFEKYADTDLANPGDTVTYTLKYKNTGTGIATNVVIIDDLPAYMTFVDADPYPSSISGNVLTWTIGDVNPGTVAEIGIEATVNAGVPDGETLRNEATLDYDDANGNPYEQLTDYWDVVTTSPVVAFMKTADVTTADPGDQIVFTLHYENTGTGAADNVVVTDTLPEHVSFVTASPYPDSVSGRVLTWYIGALGPDSEGDITVTVEVDAYVPDGTLLVNDATLDHTDVNGNQYDQLSDDAQVTVTAPILHLSKVADVQEADPGDYITYTISYYNSGSGVATGVLICDTIPDFVTFVSATPSYDDVQDRTYMWDVGTVVGNGGSGSITIVVQVDAGTADATLLHNVATLDYADANGNSYQQLTDEADVTVTAPVVDLTKTADMTTADPGDQITYTVEFTNSGSGVATNVTVRDTIPEHVTFISSNIECFDIDGRKYTWRWDVVQPGETVTLKIVVEVEAYTADQTLLHNEATADYDDDNGNPYPQLTAYADVMVTAPVFTFSKTADVETADPGDYITYTLTYQNTGTGWASNTIVDDTIPDFVDFISSSPTHTSSSGETYSWVIGDVGPGDSGQITVTVQVMVGTLDQTLLHNVATLDYADANGNPYPQMSDYADVQVTAPVFTFSKTVDAETADPGDLLTFTLCYNNRGTGSASNVVVSDTLPDHVTLQNSTPAFDNQAGQTYSWDVGDVGGGAYGCIVIVVTVDPGTADKTLLHNSANLNYADANGNPYPQMNDYSNTHVTAPIMTFSKTGDVVLADPGDPITYTLTYDNSGTGDASGVVLVDTLPACVTFISASLDPDSIIGQVLTWNLGIVYSMTGGTIIIAVQVTPGTADETLLHNAATFDYSDANGNFIEQLSGSADTTVTAPVMTFQKDAGEVTVGAYVIANFTLRIAGEKWHDVVLTLYDNNVSAAFASVTRFPGSPDDQSVTLYHVRINLLGTFSAIIEYTPLDDPINGQWWGDDPCWLTLTFENGDSKRLFHNFNVRHNETWIWKIDDLRPYIKGVPVTFEATIPYTLTYENIGTGDASNVVIADTFPSGTLLLNSSPPFDSSAGDVYTWLIGYVPSGTKGHIFFNISYVFDVNGTVLTNNASLDYSDVNGNFIETLTDSTDSMLIMPEIDYGKKGSSIDYGPMSVYLPGNPMAAAIVFGSEELHPAQVSFQPVEPEQTDTESVSVATAPEPGVDSDKHGDLQGSNENDDAAETVPGQPQHDAEAVEVWSGTEEPATDTIPMMANLPTGGTLDYDITDETPAAKELSLAGGAASVVCVDISLMLMTIILLICCAFAAAGRLVTGRK